MERFSMKEWKPDTFHDKKMRLDETISKMEEDKRPLIDRKREIETQLTDINAQLKIRMDDSSFAVVTKTRSDLAKEKYSIEEEIRKANAEIKALHLERDRLIYQNGKRPKEDTEAYLLELRDKYMAFSSDTTRVSSMRAMSSKFVEEIVAALKILKQQ